MLIRPAEEKDLPELLAIYTDEVLHGTATFDTVPPSYEMRLAWLRSHNQDNHPLLIAEIDGHAAGYASLSEFISKKAYASTVELSVYVSKNFRGHGAGKALCNAVIQLARDDPRTHRVISIVTTENTASLKLHEKLGFRNAGTLTEAGLKFGRYLSVSYLELAV